MLKQFIVVQKKCNIKRYIYIIITNITSKNVIHKCYIHDKKYMSTNNKPRKCSQFLLIIVSFLRIPHQI